MVIDMLLRVRRRYLPRRSTQPAPALWGSCPLRRSPAPMRVRHDDGRRELSCEATETSHYGWCVSVFYIDSPDIPT